MIQYIVNINFTTGEITPITEKNYIDVVKTFHPNHQQQFGHDCETLKMLVDEINYLFSM